MRRKQIDIKDLFGGLQEQMVAQLSTNRKNIQHPGSKGDSLENVWIDWLITYLPNRYAIDKAFVIDSLGQLSDQIDLVIYDRQYTPFIFSQNGIKYVPAEGVYAVFEVKPDIKGSVKQGNKNISYIEYAGNKIESVRSLKRTSTYIVDRGKSHPARSLTKIIGGILTIENSYKGKKSIKSQINNLNCLKTIDMGCIVDEGSFYVDYEGTDPHLQDDKELNNQILKYYSERGISSIKFSDRSTSLVTFFLQLSRYLQQSIGTVAAIDFDAYASNVNFGIDKEL